MENANLRPYRDLVNCHCHGDNRMLGEGDGVYACSHCGWRIRIALPKPPVKWYWYEENEDPSQFPRCMECGVQTRMEGAVHLPEGEQYFKLIVFACGPNERHGRRLLNAYPVEITREEYESFGPSREDLLCGFVEDILLDDSAPIANPSRLLQRSPDRRSGEIDTSAMTADERLMLSRMLRLLENRRLLTDVKLKENSVSFTIDEDLCKALDEGKARKSAAPGLRFNQ